MTATITQSDGLGRPIHKQILGDTLGPIYQDTSYDLLGNLFTSSNPYHSTADATYGITTTYHDALGRVTSRIAPDNSSSSFAYSGNTVASTDEAGNTTVATSDALGRLVQVVEPDQAITNYTYDVNNNLTVVNQLGVVANGDQPRTRQFLYDGLSRLITSSNPETGTICYGQWTGSTCGGGYDASGNLLAKTDANGVTQHFSYDALDRLTSQTSSDGSLSSVFFYDTAPSLYGGTPFSCTNGIGRLCQADHPSYSGTAYNYDAMGRTLSTLYASDGNGAGYFPGIAAVYDLAGNPTSITYPDGSQVTQTWDAVGRLASVSNASSNANYISDIIYTPAGAEYGFTLGNGVTQTNLYNNRLQPCRTMVLSPALAGSTISSPSGPISGPFSAGTVLDRSSFYSMSGTNCGNEPHNNGNIWSIVDNLNVGWTQSFGYDSLNRLTSALRSDGGYNHTYNYDSFGNLAVTDNLNSNPVWAADPATNQLLRNPVASVTDRYGHPLNDFIYDYAGNMVSSGTYPIGHAYTYNALNQITAVDGGNTATYDYNGDDERAVKHTPTNWTEYVYFGGQPMAELGSDGTWTDYIYANGEKIAKVSSQKSVLHIGGTDPTPEGCGVSWVLVDPASNLSGVTVQTGDKLLAHLKMGVTTQGLFGLYLFSNTGDAGSWAGVDEISGQPMQWYSQSDGAWHEVEEDLSGYAGMYIAQLWLGAQGTPGAFDMWVSDAALVRSNGSTLPIYNGQQPSGGMPGVCGETNLTYSAVMMPVTDPAVSTSYFVDDHLGTAQMELSGGGWPMWTGQFTPFGLELLDGNTDMHYKFTSKERDSETGLDNFGARYYASNMGRWMSPDWSAKYEPVPYAKLDNPQSLNLYGYMLNNPLGGVDPDGHGPKWDNFWSGAKNWWKYNEWNANENQAKALQAKHNAEADQFWRENGANVLNATMLTAGIYSASVPSTAQLEPPAASTGSLLTDLATQASQNVGSGSGAVNGTLVHSEFADLVEGLGNANLSTEVSYKGGQVVPYGTAGSVRADVVEGPVNAPTGIYDLKTGRASLTPARIAQIQSQIPGGSKVPVTEIKPK